MRIAGTGHIVGTCHGMSPQRMHDDIVGPRHGVDPQKTLLQIYNMVWIGIKHISCPALQPGQASEMKKPCIIPGAGLFNGIFLFLFRVAHSPGFPDHGDLDLAGVGHFALDLLRQVE